VAGERSLFWVDGAIPKDPGWPELEGWDDLEAWERRLRIRERQPILVDRNFRVDPRLSEVFRKSRFRRLEFGSQESYVRDYRLLFSYLWLEGRYWDEATPDDLENWEEWRLRGEGIPDGSGVRSSDGS
jgi:hypothetical protein